MASRSDRPSPSASAAKQPIGKVMRGNDGRMYKVASTVTGVHRWVPLARSARKRSVKRSVKRSARKRSVKRSVKRSARKRSVKRSAKRSVKRSVKRSARKQRWKVVGFPNTFSYPYAGRKVSGLTADEIRRHYIQVGRAWERHTKKQQDRGAATTTSQMKKRLSYYYSKGGERAWIEYSMPNNVYSAYRAGAKLTLL